MKNSDLIIYDYTGNTSDFTVLTVLEKRFGTIVTCGDDSNGEIKPYCTNIMQKIENRLYNDAIGQLAKKIQSCADGAFYLCDGSLTTAAILFAAYPELKDKIRCLIFISGVQGICERNPISEKNVVADPISAKMIFQSGIRLTVLSDAMDLQTYLDTDFTAGTKVYCDVDVSGGFTFGSLCVDLMNIEKKIPNITLFRREEGSSNDR
ncbi:MAG: nucleoside hydrolase [Oscillospiraceae bacterium]